MDASMKRLNETVDAMDASKKRLNETVGAMDAKKKRFQLDSVYYGCFKETPQ